MQTPTIIREGKIVFPSVEIKERAAWQTMTGFGDNLYSRAALKLYVAKGNEVLLFTNRPHLYDDIPGVILRDRLFEKGTPQEVEALIDKHIVKQVMFYAPEDLRHGTIYGYFYRRMGLTERPSAAHYDTPPLPDFPLPDRYFYVKDVALRGTWLNPARACDTRYLHEAVSVLRAKYPTTPIIATRDDSETTPDPVDADIVFKAQDISELQLLRIVKNAALCVGPVCWMVPGALCTHTPTVIIMGGYQGLNRPDNLVPEDCDTMRFIDTDHPCMCEDMTHACRKDISAFAQKFEALLSHFAKENAEVSVRHEAPAPQALR
ncbi:MAG: hypothetical protein IRZ03_13585 [Acidobacterium ailaaui]|nr:hypothetical protein [Pseudacidobacterium ailaaui]